MKLRFLESTYLKPTWQQSAEIVAEGMGNRMILYEKGTELEAAHCSLINGHQYVVLENTVSGSDRGFIWSPFVQIDGQVETSAPATIAEPPSKPQWALKGDFAGRVVGYMVDKGYALADGRQERNIIYIEGVNLNGKENSDRFNQWNDLSLIISFFDNSPYLVFRAKATTEPGDHYTYNPMNPKGAFRIAFDQFKAAWRAGHHGRDRQWALIQAGQITGHRDFNKDGSRTGDRKDTGSNFWVNQHGPYTSGTVGRSSAGCLVRESMREHQRFMRFLTDSRDGDPRYLRDRGYRWDTTVIDGSDFARSKWGYG